MTDTTFTTITDAYGYISGYGDWDWGTENADGETPWETGIEDAMARFAWDAIGAIVDAAATYSAYRRLATDPDFHPDGAYDQDEVDQWFISLFVQYVLHDNPSDYKLSPVHPDVIRHIDQQTHPRFWISTWRAHNARLLPALSRA